MKKNLSTVIGVTSLAASLLGIYYLVKKNQSQNNTNQIPGGNQTIPQDNPQQVINQPVMQDLIGHTVLASQSSAILYHAIDRGNYWEKADTIRLVAKKNDQLGTVIAIVEDGFTNDVFAIIDIPFYIGSILKRGHGFINTKYIKTL